MVLKLDTCVLKPQVGVDAAASAIRGVFCAAWLERMIVHDAAVVPKTEQFLVINLEGDDMKSAREHGVNLASLVAYVRHCRPRLAPTRGMITSVLHMLEVDTLGFSTLCRASRDLTA